MHHFKKCNLLLLFLLLTNFLSAQERPVASGGEAKGAGGSVSFSIGQLDYINITSSTAKITQGVQQPHEIIIYPGDKPVIIDRNPDFGVYPNPTKDFTVLHIKTPTTKRLSYVLYDMLGRTISRAYLLDVRTTIRMETLPSAVYILVILDDDNNKVLSQFKIVKII